MSADVAAARPRGDAGAHHRARWWHALPDGRIQCDLCPRECRLHDGQRGLCFVRQREGDAVVLTTWGRSSGFAVDPIEKKPLNHFHPGSTVLSFGTAGCNLACRFCQNWDISKSREMDRLTDRASPARIAEAARGAGCTSVAFTYNDPVVFAEYAMDTADACHALGVQAVAVTAGYIHAGPRREFFAKMDAANVDLKAFDDAFYFRQTGAHLAPVLETLEHIVHETRCWLEITTLLVPGHNDGNAELEAMSRWIVEHLGPEVPLHFTAFHPDYRMTDVAATPLATVRRARAIALANGLHHVYTGNVHDAPGGTTCCTHCERALVERDWHRLLRYDLDALGRCGHCGTTLAGRFGAARPRLGVRHVPTRLRMA
ncbi:MAG: AmmeMemoRadiSam system radical SAM enzyme, partial [Proteobacteria bacterium]|nr:AmmeMemoRadiSam system radical SAM enzyme [Pseudomonadota bacterium]